nr:MAG TPA: hypothetical protein [Caudoviricetes sp.]
MRGSACEGAQDHGRFPTGPAGGCDRGRQCLRGRSQE